MCGTGTADEKKGRKIIFFSKTVKSAHTHSARVREREMLSE